jgi:hypothetical protein
MSEGSGVTLVDHAGGQNLTANFINWEVVAGMSNVGAAVAGFNGGQFAGAAGYVADLDWNGTQSKTLSVWVDPTSVTSEAICGNISPSAPNVGWEAIIGGNPSAAGLIMSANYPTNNYFFGISGTPTVATPQHICITYGGGNTNANVSIYVNGVSQSVTNGSNQNQLTSTFTQTSTFFSVGGNSLSGQFNGFLSYMRTWNQVLTAAQVAALYAAGPQ